MNHLLDGIVQHTVATTRYRASVLSTEDRPAPPGADALVLVHGNVSSSWFFQPLMLALPFRTIAVDLRGFGDSETLPVDARRGLDDFADDVDAVVEALGLDRIHLFGWSLGGAVAARQLINARTSIASLTLQAPAPPFGVGGTSADGTLLQPDAAGTGGGAANPQFLNRLAEGDTSSGEGSPRQVFRSLYVAAGHADDAGLEDLWVDAMLSTAVGDDNYPGDSMTSSAWPGFAPGERGVLNALSPKYLSWAEIVHVPAKPPVLWIRGDADVIVGDASTSDINHFGALGVIPGWPGEEVAPRQPMIAQTGAVLEHYSANGGQHHELILPGVGHSPHLERAAEVQAALRAHIEQ